MSPNWKEMRQLDGQGFLPDTARPSTTWLQQYIHPSDEPHVTAAIEKAVRTKGLFELEHRVRRLDGSLGWTLSRAVPLLDANGEVVTEWFGAASDVTDRKVAEQRQRFLLLLSDRLRVLGEPQSIMDAAVEALGQHSRASRVGYGQVQPGGESIALQSSYTDGVEPLKGVFPLAGFGVHNIAQQRLGVTVVWKDVAADSTSNPESWAAIDRPDCVIQLCNAASGKHLQRAARPLDKIVVAQPSQLKRLRTLHNSD